MGGTPKKQSWTIRVLKPVSGIPPSQRKPPYIYIYIHTHIVPILSRIIIRIYVNQKKKHPYSGYIVTIAIYPDIII